MDRIHPVVMLVLVGAAWGLSLPLMRVAVSTGFQPLGLILWQNIIMAAVLLATLMLMRKPVRLAPRYLGLFAAVAFFGAVLPGYFSFLTAVDLPAGVRSIIIAIVPMFALPMALLLGMERPDIGRAAGVVLGALAIGIIAQPGAGVTRMVGLGVLLLALITPFSYAVEVNYLAWRGSDGLHPFQLLLGASIVGILLCWPLAEATGQMLSFGGWGAAELAVLASGVLNALAYSGYVWLVARAGSLFASQAAYLVTGFGVLWSMVLLGERYSVWVWAALGLMLVGVALVQPRRTAIDKA